MIHAAGAVNETPLYRCVPDRNGYGGPRQSTGSMVSPEPDAVFTGTIRDSPITDRCVVEIPHDVDDAIKPGHKHL